MRGRSDRLSVHLHMIRVRVNFRTEFSDDLPVNGNPPGLDVFLTFAA
jgi:hypothetical protein